MARPKKDPNEQRSESARATLTVSEKLHVQEQAQLAGLQEERRPQPDAQRGRYLHHHDFTRRDDEQARPVQEDRRRDHLRGVVDCRGARTRRDDVRFQEPLKGLEPCLE